MICKTNAKASAGSSTDTLALFLAKKSKAAYLLSNWQNANCDVDFSSYSWEDMSYFAYNSNNENSLVTTPQANKMPLNSIKNFSYGFFGNYNLTSAVDYNMPNCTNINYMFYGCTNLTTPPNIVMKTPSNNVVISMRNAFYNSKITSIPAWISHYFFDAGSLFNNCRELENVDIENLLTFRHNSQSMASMFAGCTGLKTAKITYHSCFFSISYLFRGCTSLTKAEVLLDDKPYTDRSTDSMCMNCYMLNYIKFDYFTGYGTGTTYTSNMFNNCYSLTKLIIQRFANTQQLNSNAFTNCYHLSGTYNATYNPNGINDGYIYVPSTMVDTLKVATNWSVYATQIRSIDTLTTITINGTTYNCEDDETWEHWLASANNTGGFTSSNTFKCTDYTTFYVNGVQTTDASGFDFTSQLSTWKVIGGNTFTIS